MKKQMIVMLLAGLAVSSVFADDASQTSNASPSMQAQPQTQTGNSTDQTSNSANAQSSVSGAAVPQNSQN